MFTKVKKPTPWLVVIVAAGLLATTASVTLAVRTDTPKSDITDQTVAVASKDLTVQIKANDVVQAMRKINLSPKDSGRIAQLYVDEGDRVLQGEVVAPPAAQVLPGVDTLRF